MSLTSATDLKQDPTKLHTILTAKSESTAKEAAMSKLVEPVRPPFPLAGYLAQLVEVFVASSLLLCLKLLPVEESIQEKTKAAMIRCSFMVLFFGLQIIHQGGSFRVPRQELWLNITRTLLGGLIGLLLFAALKYITIGESTAITYSSCVWTCLLSYALLGEPLQASLVLALPLNLLGIVLLAKPDLIVKPDDEFGYQLGPQSNSTLSSIGSSKDDVGQFLEHRWPGIAIALINSLLLSLVFVVMKFRKLTPIITSSFYVGLAGVLVTFCSQLVVGFGAMPTGWLEWALHLSIGILSYIEQYSFQWSIQFVPAGIFSIVQCLEIVLGFVLGAIFLRDLVLWTSVAGSALIILVVVILVLESHLFRARKRSAREQIGKE